VLRHGNGIAVDSLGSPLAFTELAEARGSLHDEPVEMVEAAPMREEFRALLQTVLDEGFGMRETLPLDQLLAGIEQGISKLHQEREQWRARAEKMNHDGKLIARIIIRLLGRNLKP
jgi:hypothetical protein